MTTANEVARVLLPWVGERTRDSLNGPTLGTFLADHPEFTEDDAMRAADRAGGEGLLKVLATFDEAASFELVLQPAGFECVEEFGSDLNAYLAARRGGGSTTINQSTITMGDHGQASAFTGGDVDQSITEITADPARLLDVSKMAREVVGVLPEHARDEVRAAATELGDAAGDGAGDGAVEDEDRVRSAAARLIAALTPFSAGLTVVRFIIDFLTGTLG